MQIGLRSVPLVIILLVFVAGCGSGSSASSSQASPTATDTTAKVASGDISDTATFLTYHGHGYSIQYVEGWGLQTGAGAGVTISDKDSAEIVALKSGIASAAVYAAADLARLAQSQPKYHLVSRQTVNLVPGQSVHVQYRTLSASDPVTGKRVPVLADRYYIPGSGNIAVITLQTPIGVDNVDAFRRIAHSFRWK